MGQVDLGKVVGDDGASVYIKFNSTPSDANATDSWSSGQNYIGVITSHSAAKPSVGYMWAKFVGSNGADGKSCYIKYNALPQDSGATDAWSTGQNYIGIQSITSAAKPATGYMWSKFIDDSIRTGIDSNVLGISASSDTHYYLGRTVSGTISGTATVVLTHCAGSITVLGNNAKVYIVNSPLLTLTTGSITINNYHNIFRDGLAVFEKAININKTFDTLTISTNIYADTALFPAANLSSYIEVKWSVRQTNWFEWNGKNKFESRGDGFSTSIMVCATNGGNVSASDIRNCILVIAGDGLNAGLAASPPSSDININIKTLKFVKEL
jgi:hypothetical protein